jgi:hypothetical protein
MFYAAIQIISHADATLLSFHSSIKAMKSGNYPRDKDLAMNTLRK